MVLMTLASFASHPVHGGATSVLGAYPNPFRLNWVPRAVADTGVVVIFGGVVASIASLWVRHRRSSGETRRRYMVVLYAFWLLGFGVAFGLALSDAIGGVAWWPAMVGWILLPASFVVALVRHVLYGVDKVVSRTVTYGLLAVAVTVVYTIPVLLAPRLIGWFQSGDRGGGDSRGPRQCSIRCVVASRQRWTGDSTDLVTMPVERWRRSSLPCRPRSIWKA